MDEETAINKAIEEMGDPVLIGTELDRTHKPKTEWTIIGLTGIIILLGFGIRFLVSYEPDIYFTTGRSLTSTIIGIGCMMVAYFIDFTTIGRYPKSIFLGLITLTMGVMFISPTIRGQLVYGNFILLLFPTAMSGIIYNMRSKGYLGIILSGAILSIPIIIGMMGGSLSNVFLLILAFLLLITISIMKGWFNVNKIKGLLLVYGSTALIGGIVLINSASYINDRINRILISIYPFKDPLGNGYISAQMRNILSNAKLIGRGTLGDIPYMIPGMNTDYILTYLIHRLGWLAFFLVMTIIFIFIIRSFILSSRQKSVLGRLVSMAVLTTFTMEVILYTITNLGFPVMGSLTLPFISYSGTSTIINMILIGIMLSVFRSGDIVRDSKLIEYESQGKFLEIIDGKIIIDLNSK